MINGRKIAVVMPAYNAEKTLKTTYDEVIDQQVVDLIIVVDDGSKDKTEVVARDLPGVLYHRHPENRGYGGNQKTCYQVALEAGADIIIMIHPDYQYTPRLIVPMASIIANDVYPCTLGSRILGGYARKLGMPWWKYLSNRALTMVENLLLGAKLSEYHTGYRAYSREVLLGIDFHRFNDNFLFDNQMLAAIIWKGLKIGEITCPTKYFEEASSINFWNSTIYGLGCMKVAIQFRLARMNLYRGPLFSK